MICVSIGRGRHKHMIAEHRHLVEQGAPLVELRLDYINGMVNLKRFLPERPGPVIITCRREQDGGKWSRSEEDRQMLLRAAIAEGVEYVDLEDDVAQAIPRFGKTRRIVSMHDFARTPENLVEIHARLAACDADVVKLSTMANSTHDNARMLQLVADSEQPTVGICMGEIGTPSRILAAKFGAPFTYSTFHHERTLAPGQLSFRQMQEVYRYDGIQSDTEVYGVIGDPIGQGHGAIIHNAAFRHLGLNKVYVPFRVPREDLDSFFEDCPQLGIKGLNAAIPHKEGVIPHLGRVDGTVRGVGAANTIVFEDGTAIGYNSDYRAAMDCIDVAVGAEREDPLKGNTALVLGAGGSARAVAFGLRRRGANIVIAGRTFERAQQLAERHQGRAVEWASRHSVKPQILVNCTPVGMHPEVDETPFDKHHLRPAMVVFDMVYNPEQTLLVKHARQQSCKVVTGVEMFIRQAALQIKWFTSQEAPRELMREELKRATAAVKY